MIPPSDGLKGDPTVVATPGNVRRGTPELGSSWESWTEVWAEDMWKVSSCQPEILKMSGIENCADRKDPSKFVLLAPWGKQWMSTVPGLLALS